MSGTDHKTETATRLRNRVIEALNDLIITPETSFDDKVVVKINKFKKWLIALDNAQ